MNKRVTIDPVTRIEGHLRVDVVDHLGALRHLLEADIGTANGAAAHPSITTAVAAACHQAPGVSSVVNGRFKGGYITRHYGQPAHHVHAVQLEKCQSLYMQEVPPFAYDEARAAQIQPVLKAMVGAALQAAGALYGH